MFDPHPLNLIRLLQVTAHIQGWSKYNFERQCDPFHAHQLKDLFSQMHLAEKYLTRDEINSCSRGTVVHPEKGDSWAANDCAPEPNFHRTLLS